MSHKEADGSPVFTIVCFLAVLLTVVFAFLRDQQIRNYDPHLVENYQKGDAVKYKLYSDYKISNGELLTKMEKLGDAKRVGSREFDVYTDAGKTVRVSYALPHDFSYRNRNR